jgi:hypothetical protein
VEAVLKRIQAFDPVGVAARDVREFDPREQRATPRAWPDSKGLTYQVQTSTNLTSWESLGSPRFALDAADSLYIGLSHAGYYRVMWLH